MRITCSSGDTAADVLRRVQEEALASQAYAYYPLHEIQARCTSVRELIDHLLIFENYPVPARTETDGGTEEAGLEITGFEAEERTNYDLTVMIQPGEELRIHFDYNGRTYEEEAMRRLQGHWMGLLEQIAANPLLPVEELEVLTAAEREEVLYGWNATALELPEQTTLPALLQAQAERTPEAPAVVYGGAAWTYGQLHGRSNAIARWLGERGVKREERVGVLMSRTPQLIAGLLGILKAGGAYVPMDPSLPAERLEAMIRDAGIRVVLSETAQRGVLDGLRGIPLREVLCLDAAEKAAACFGVLPVEDGIRPPAAGLRETAAALEEAAEARNTADDLPASSRELVWAAGAEHASAVDFAAAEQSASGVLQADGSVDGLGSAIVYTFASALAAYSAETVETDVRPEDSAYVMYTSGTTGTPKGVVVEHRNVVNFIAGMLRELPFGEGRSMLGITTVSFDIFVTESWVPLACGMKIVLAGEAEQEDAGLLAELLEQQPVQMLQTTPSRLQMLLGDGRSAAQLRPLDAVLVGGEPLPASLPRALGAYTEAAVYNMYGPTETTVWSTYDRVKAGERITIGRPIVNTQVYVVNASLQPQPVGAAGELCIGGAGVAREYGARAELTAEKFVESPFVPGERMYRTGDLARWLPDGRLEHLGRIDHQVKIRGYRIELGEIEAKLLQAEGVREAVVTVLAAEGAETAQELCAYVTGERELAAGELRGRLAAVLPSYMIPSYFVQLAELPLTTSGKVDRRRLPRPDAASSAGAEKGFIAPRNAVEAQLARLWQEVLGVERVSIREDFFELGGHSLRAMTLISRIHQAMGAELPLRQLFLTPTVEGLAAAVEAAGAGTYEGLQPAPKQAYYPLTSAQKRLYVLQQLEGAELSYNMPAALKLTGRLDRTRLERALRAMIARHDVLRTSFAVVDGEPVQLVQEAVEFAVGYEEAEEHQAEERIRAFLQPFDLAEAPLLRAAVIRLAAEEHLLLLDLHHIVSDGASMSLFVEEFTQLYAGRTPDPLRLQYKDYAVWQSEFRRSGGYLKQRDYWLHQMEGSLPVLELPTDHPRPAVRRFAGDRVSFPLDGVLSEGLRQLARNSGATIHMVLLSAFSAFLARLTRQEEVIIGTPVAGRTHADLSGMIGMFVNTLALRTSPGGAKCFAGLLEEVKQTSLDALEHGDYPLEELIDEVVRERELSRNPLFDAVFVMQNTEAPRLELSGLSVEAYPASGSTAKFDLTLQVTEHAEGFHGELEFSTALFSKETVKRWAAYFTNLLGQAVLAPETPVAQLKLAGREEEARLLAFSGLPVRMLDGASIIDRFEEVVRLTPDSPAIVYENRILTYGQLHERASRIAGRLVRAGLQPCEAVGLSADRSIEFAAAVLGTLLAGGMYVPLDPEAPEERLAYMLGDSGAKLLLTTAEAPVPAAYEGFVIRIEEAMAGEEPQAPEMLRRCAPEDPAYLMYTSGTTGRPKGVLVTHGSVVNLAVNSRIVPFHAGHRFAQTGAVGFDAVTFELFGALLHGAVLYPVNKEVLLDARRLGAFLSEHAITMMFLTTSLFHQLADEDERLFAGLQHVLMGGETLSPWHAQAVRRACPQLNVWNGYGPTENTTFSTVYAVEDNSSAAVLPIGRPIGGTTAYVLDTGGQLLPVGIPGELWVGGAGVSRGYWNLPELTGEKFKPDPFLPGGTMYATGDLARWLPDGTLEYGGRIDQQVKLRGHRIEPAEIEAQLLLCEGIRQAAAIIRRDLPGHEVLCAYYVGAPGVEPAQLRDRLREVLPAYMVPEHYMALAELPLTRNGKLDRAALPAPTGKTTVSLSYEAPRTAAEILLAGLWQELLKLPRVGRDDHFFDRGGHSLRAMTLVSRIHKEAGVAVGIADIFRHPKLEAMARLIDQGAGEPFRALHPAGTSDHYPMSSAQKRMYVLHQLGGTERSYNIPMVLRLEGTLDRERLEAAFAELIRRHDILRTSMVLHDGEPVQVIRENVPFAVLEMDSDDNRVNEALQEFFVPFDLSAAPLLRAGIVRLGRESCLLLLDMHHIVSDGISMGVLIREFSRLYAGERLEPLRLQYKDYSVWQRQFVASEAYRLQEAYWLARFDGDLPVLDLPVDGARGRQRSFAGGAVDFEIGPDLTAQLRELARQAGATVFMLLLAAYSILLSRLSGQEDVVVGTPTAGRPHADVQEMIGVFVNTLALRTQPENAKGFAEYLEEVKQTALGAFAHGDYPFEDLVDQVVSQRDLSRSPLFDAMLVLQNMEREELVMDSLRVTPVTQETPPAKFDLTLTVTEQEESMRFRFGYAAALFERETIERWAVYFESLLRSIASNPQLPLADLRLSGGTGELCELSELSYVVGIPAEEAPERTMDSWFSRQAALAPERTAVVSGQYALTYQELERRSDRLAWLLRERGVRAGTIVGLLLPPSVDLLVGVLGIWKAGGAYLPLDPETDDSRILYMLEDAQAPLLLTSAVCRHPWDPRFEAVLMEELELELAAPVSRFSAVQRVHGEEDLAYMIYTSGSTGAPKGVQVPHRSVTAYVRWFIEEASIGSDDRTALLSSFAFDLGYTAVFPALLSGAELHLPDREVYMDPARLLRLLTEKGITYAKMTPSLLGALAGSPAFAEHPGDGALRLLVLGGEAIRCGDVDRYFEKYPHSEVMQHYGPTETTIGSIALRMDRMQFGRFRLRPVLGRPIAGERVYILDAEAHPVPQGIVGEIAIGGLGVSRGYRNLPQLSNASFIADPYNTGYTLYRTGDRGRLLPDGTIEYLGRGDHQVKIRGYRVELGEIEQELSRMAEVREVAVLALPDAVGSLELTAYAVLEPKGELVEIRTQLRDRLPSYMIPARFVTLERLPLTVNGKVDRIALAAQQGGRVPAAEYTPPGSRLEEVLAQIWQEVLGIERIGIHDNFFEAGGHSLKLIHMTGEVRRRLGEELALRTAFAHPTIQELATHLNRRHSGEDSGVDGVSVWNRGCGSLVHCFPPIVGYGQVFRGIAEVLQGEVEVYAYDYVPRENAAEAYARRVRELQPRGPIRLLGYSAGGNLAFEVAKVLEGAGRNVADLLLLDAYPREAAAPLQDDAAKDAYVESLQQEISRFLGEVQGFSADEVTRNIIEYKTWLDANPTSGIVSADIHLVRSESIRAQGEEVRRSWKAWTTGAEYAYAGTGLHEEMLEERAVRSNGALVKTILARLRQEEQA
ncbi:hypothetical protein B2K_39560 [Paenibacillus mucilaginosus K02]|uniref:Carrier domain-containing protein n=1 Tax=Paenibacillus mucilaginosus K02 TaxID=997761 RepID=R9UPG9_9BACL|nr:non-ribosomal peptide synthetase [Paenibacillus mucilaginosus]AGN70717.1 hypothetical protein B2K_39560 [Paenibacillus mucilaginosus K02]